MSKKIEWEQFFVWNKKKFKLKSKLCFLPSITYFPYLKNNIAQFHISAKFHNPGFSQAHQSPDIHTC